ncbi:hypothetical protein EVAR_81250_1 [Eumeta japonica]|uniref:Uncharacterized protein n=1 Tax=Eumeta variegata TaxID=151549 RepID=A0A4C1WTY9_EUMVA|nr:hypothetical protein EVAR_81250_1 [Eumeta japonica]
MLGHARRGGVCAARVGCAVSAQERCQPLLLPPSCYTFTGYVKQCTLAHSGIRLFSISLDNATRGVLDLFSILYRAEAVLGFYLVFWNIGLQHFRFRKIFTGTADIVMPDYYRLTPSPHLYPSPSTLMLIYLLSRRRCLTR